MRIDPSTLRADAQAGLTTAVMLIPQAMAYAMLAGLPPVVGLYASTVPLVAYMLRGTSKQLAVGPVAMDSLLVAVTLSAFPGLTLERGVALAAGLALMVGALQLTLGLVRAGFVVNFLSRPVLAGFMSAAALIIASSQAKHFLGVAMPRTNLFHEWVVAMAQHVGEIHGLTALVGALAFASLVAIKTFLPRVPAALVVVTLSIVITHALALHAHGLAIVGDVPAGLPRFQWQLPARADMHIMMPGAATIALVAFVEAISVAQTIARKRGDRIDANRELQGLGLANLAAGLFQGYPVTGGLSRTAVNAAAGARSQWAALVTAASVALVVLFFTPLLSHLPSAVLAAIIMQAVFGLVDVSAARRLWKVDRADFSLLVLTFVATLTLGIQPGIAVGVLASLLWFLVRTTRPHTAVLGRLPGSEIYRNLKRFADAQAVPGVVIVRMDAQFYFGNVSFFQSWVERTLANERSVYAIVLEATSINRMDSSAEAALGEVLTLLETRNVAFYVAGLKGPVRDMLKRSGLWERLGPARMHFTTHQAVLAAQTAAPKAGPHAD